MKPASLDNLMNRYVFGYANPPLRNLHASIEGNQLRQEGIMHKIVDIPFTMWADVSADHGLIWMLPSGDRAAVSSSAGSSLRGPAAAIGAGAAAIAGVRVTTSTSLTARASSRSR